MAARNALKKTVDREICLLFVFLQLCHNQMHELHNRAVFLRRYFRFGVPIHVGIVTVDVHRTVVRNGSLNVLELSNLTPAGDQLAKEFCQCGRDDDAKRQR